MSSTGLFNSWFRIERCKLLAMLFTAGVWGWMRLPPLCIACGFVTCGSGMVSY